MIRGLLLAVVVAALAWWLWTHYLQTSHSVSFGDVFPPAEGAAGS